MLVTIIFYYWRKACFCEWKKIRGFNDNDVDDNDSLGMHLMKNEWRLTATTLVPRVSISHSLAAHHWLCFMEDEHHLKETSFVPPSPPILVWGLTSYVITSKTPGLTLHGTPFPYTYHKQMWWAARHSWAEYIYWYFAAVNNEHKDCTLQNKVFQTSSTSQVETFCQWSSRSKLT